MQASPFSFDFDGLGGKFAISVWDECTDAEKNSLQKDIPAYCESFESQYSRFRPHSLTSTLSTKTGIVRVPTDLVNMLRVYENLYMLSRGAFTPLVGRTLESMGYDTAYSLVPKTEIVPVPALPDVVRILDDEHIELLTPTLFDFGGMGKGYCVDRMSDMLRSRGLKRFLINGSGDIFYTGDGHPIRCGLEHPDDPTKVIGVLELTHGSLSASGANRRRWDAYHHIINPHTLQSPESILGTWVAAPSATYSDAFATCLFLVEPKDVQSLCPFEYCIMNDQYAVQRSKGFTAELFTAKA